MKIFQQILEYINPTTNVRSRPLLGEGGFVGEDAKFRLQQLVEHPGWQDFLLLLDREVSIQGEVMLQSRDSAVLNEARGQVIAFRKAAFLVDEINNASRAFDRSVEQRRIRDAAADDSYSAVAYGTPIWGR